MYFHRWCSHLFGTKNNRHHTLWFRSLGALIDQDGAELHLSQARISCPDAGAADHICILRHNHMSGYHKNARGKNESSHNILIKS